MKTRTHRAESSYHLKGKAYQRQSAGRAGRSFRIAAFLDSTVRSSVPWGANDGRHHAPRRHQDWGAPSQTADL